MQGEADMLTVTRMLGRSSGQRSTSGRRRTLYGLLDWNDVLSNQIPGDSGDELQKWFDEVMGGDDDTEWISD